MHRVSGFILLFSLIAGISAFSGNQPTVPSFDEFSAWSQRHPDTDTDLDLYHRSWWESTPHEGHGGLVEQEILFPGDPLDPPRRGAVLKHLKELNHAFLPTGRSTETTSHAARQTQYVVMDGTGHVEAGGKTAALSYGSVVFIPAGLAYRFVNTGIGPLEMYLFTEEISAGFEPQKDMTVGNFADNPPGQGQKWHWAHNSRGVPQGKFANPLSFGIITIDAFDIAQPHVAPIGIEEVWLQIQGTSLMYFGNRLFRHEAGEAFYITPNYKVPHCSINTTGEPRMWMYIGIRHDRAIPVTLQMQALIDSLTVKE